VPGFYDADPLEQIAINLFHGWGYNFYRVENQLRADDQLIRSKAAWLLGLTAASLSAAEADYRREFLPAPSRAQPFPDAAAVATAQRLERIGRDICALEASLQQLPVPENDRMTQRYRQEAPTLQTLINYDHILIGQCDLLRSLAADQSPAVIIEKLPEMETGLAAIRSTLQSRQAILLGPIPC
jgi:hypothetical protein